MPCLKIWLMQLCGGKNVFLGSTGSSMRRVDHQSSSLPSAVLVYLMLGFLATGTFQKKLKTNYESNNDMSYLHSSTHATLHFQNRQWKRQQKR